MCPRLGTTRSARLDRRSAAVVAPVTVLLRDLLLGRRRTARPGRCRRLGAGHGPDHPDTLTSRSNLAYAYQVAGLLDEALPLFKTR